MAEKSGHKPDPLQLALKYIERRKGKTGFIAPPRRVWKFGSEIVIIEDALGEVDGYAVAKGRVTFKDDSLLLLAAESGLLEELGLVLFPGIDMGIHNVEEAVAAIRRHVRFGTSYRPVLTPIPPRWARTPARLTFAARA